MTARGGAGAPARPRSGQASAERVARSGTSSVDPTGPVLDLTHPFVDLTHALVDLAPPRVDLARAIKSHRSPSP